MAASEFIDCFKQRVGRSIRTLFLVLLAGGATTAHSQWTALSTPGQSTRTVAKEPTVLAIAKSARILAVGFDQSKSVAFYHADTGVLLGSTNLPKEPVAIVVSDDGTKAYALYESSGIKIAVINTATRAITSTWSNAGDPVGMVLNGSELLVADKNGDRLVGISTTNGIVTRTKSLSKEPRMIGVGAASALIVVGNKEGELQLLNSSTLAVTRTVKVGDELRSLAWWDGGSTGSGRVLAVGKSQNALNVVDPATGTIARVALGGDPNAVGVENHNNWAYVGEKDDQIISLIDLIDKALSGYFTIPGKIGSMLFDQQGAQLFVTLTKDDKLLKLDPNQASLISKVGVTKTLKDVAVNSATSDAITISDKDADFARINLATHAVQTLVLPVKADKVVVDSSLNVAIIGTTNDKLSFVNLATQPASLYPQQVDLDGDIKGMAVDPVRSITVAVVSDRQHIRVINNVTRTEIAAVHTSDKYVAVAIHSGKGIAYLATDNKKLALFSLTSRTVTQTINLNFDVEGIAVDPALNRAVLTTKDQDKAWILNLDSLQMVTSIAMAKNPGAVAIQTDTHVAVVASKDDDSLSLIDLNNNTATLNFSQIDKPTGLAISNRFNKVLVVSADKNDLAIVQLTNAAATVDAISPAQVAAGAGATTLNITGARFVDGAVAYFGTTPLATTWLSSNRLSASIPASLLVTPGTYGIRVQNPAPAGGTSASIPFTVGASGLPGAPTIGVAVAANAQASISFAAPASNGGSSITSYTVTSNPGAITATGSASPIVVTGLINGIAYTFTVKAGNANGSSAASAVSNSVTPATVPGAPVMGAASAGDRIASVTFATPTSNGGLVIATYTATSSPGNITASCVAPCASISIPGLVNGTAYTFTVNAVNAVGVGSPSVASNSVTPVGGVPVLNSVMPTAVEADNSAKTFSLTGVNFYPPVSVIVGAETFATTSSTLTSAQIALPARLFSAAGQLSLSVKTTVGVSNSRILEITPPAPRLVSNTPATLNANSQTQSLTLTGANFVAPVKVRFDGSLVATTFISPTQLSVSIPGTLVATAKASTVTAETAMGTSNILAISVIFYVPNELPIVQIYQPYGNEYPAGESIVFSANAYDPDGYIEKMEIVENGAVLETQFSQNFYLEKAFSTGQHTVVVRATDDRGGIGEVSVSFFAVPSLDEPLMAVWDGMNDALRQGDTNKALTYLTTGAQEKYRSVFEALISDMPGIIASFSKPSRGLLAEDMAEYVIMRDIASEGGTQVFFIYFLKDSYGKWLVDSM